MDRNWHPLPLLPAAEISLLVGFDEANSFYRAFRKWTGTTPEAIRHPPKKRRK